MKNLISPKKKKEEKKKLKKKEEKKKKRMVKGMDRRLKKRTACMLQRITQTRMHRTILWMKIRKSNVQSGKPVQDREWSIDLRPRSLDLPLSNGLVPWDIDQGGHDTPEPSLHLDGL